MIENVLVNFLAIYENFRKLQKFFKKSLETLQKDIKNL